MKVGDRSLRNI